MCLGDAREHQMSYPYFCMRLPIRCIHNTSHYYCVCLFPTKRIIPKTGFEKQVLRKQEKRDLHIKHKYIHTLRHMCIFLHNIYIEIDTLIYYHIWTIIHTEIHTHIYSHDIHSLSNPYTVKLWYSVDIINGNLLEHLR